MGWKNLRSAVGCVHGHRTRQIEPLETDHGTLARQASLDLDFYHRLRRRSRRMAVLRRLLGQQLKPI